MKPAIHILVLAAASCVVFAQGFAFVQRDGSVAPQPSPNASRLPETAASHGVAALGRLEPSGEVIHISAGNRAGAKIKSMFVREGQFVRAGQPIACLDTYDIHAASVQKAERDVALYQSRRTQLSAAPKSADLAAQDALISRLSHEATKAKSDAARYEYLYKEGAVSASTYEEYQTDYQSKASEVARAQSTRDAMSEVRAVDIDVADLDTECAKARLAQAVVERDNDLIRSPASGTVLCINTRAGEKESADGIADIGATNQMYARVEVYDTDLRNVRVGQSAKITGDAMERPVDGIVERIGHELVAQSIMSNDPSADIDRRVVPVHVRIKRSDIAACRKLTNAVVEVRFK